jgi:glutaredoxin-related protein
VERDRFHRLRDWCGWNLLPIVFVRGHFVGGADEFFEAVRGLGLDDGSTGG